MAASGEFVEHTTAMAVEEKAKLQKHFGRFDMFFFLICTLVGVDTLGPVASYGAEGFTWLIFLAIFFFIPYALLTAELGSAFTEEGGRTSGRSWPGAGSWRCHQRGALLDLEPDLDGRPADASRRSRPSRCSSPTLDNLGLYGFGARVHLVRHRCRDPVVRHRQVDPDDRRMVADVRCSASSR